MEIGKHGVWLDFWATDYISHTRFAPPVVNPRVTRLARSSADELEIGRERLVEQTVGYRTGYRQLNMEIDRFLIFEGYTYSYNHPDLE